jgi:hypothetical protein
MNPSIISAAPGLVSRSEVEPLIDQDLQNHRTPLAVRSLSGDREGSNIVSAR